MESKPGTSSTAGGCSTTKQSQLVNVDDDNDDNACLLQVYRWFDKSKEKAYPCAFMELRFIQVPGMYIEL